LQRITLALVAAALLGLPTVASGVAPAAPASAKSADPKLMVLRLNDLPSGFERERGYGHYTSNAQTAKNPAAATFSGGVRWGRINGYDAVFRRSATVGLITVSSSASTYRTALGADRSLRDSYRELTNEPKFHRLSNGRTIGNDSRVYRYTAKKSGITYIAHMVLWRWKTVRANVFAVWTVRPEFAVALARKQQRRIQAEVP
jgi:hypothetical protein